MAGKQDDATISQAYREHRPYLVDPAFRMLGDLGAAEDVSAFNPMLRAGFRLLGIRQFMRLHAELTG